jgi:tetratricopeptide (TPR) repeat protein
VTQLSAPVRQFVVALGCAAVLLLGSHAAVAAVEDQARAADDAFTAGANRPATAHTLYALSQVLATQGRDDQCANVLGQCIKKYPKFLPAYVSLAELHLRNNRPPQAMQTLLAGLKIAPKDPRLINNLGMCFLLKHDPAAALPLFTRAVGLAPTEGRYRANMATALGLLGRYDESLALYQQVVSEGDAHYNVALLCRATGEQERAGREFARAAELAHRPALPATRPATNVAPRAPASAPAKAR